MIEPQDHQNDQISIAMDAYDNGELTRAEFRAAIERAKQSGRPRPWLRSVLFAIIGACAGSIIAGFGISLGGDTRATYAMVKNPTEWLEWAAILGAVIGGSASFVWRG
jgi:anti-sigma factor RsiW